MSYRTPPRPSPYDTLKTIQRLEACLQSTSHEDYDRLVHRLAERLPGPGRNERHVREVLMAMRVLAQDQDVELEESRRESERQRASLFRRVTSPTMRDDLLDEP